MCNLPLIKAPTTKCLDLRDQLSCEADFFYDFGIETEVCARANVLSHIRDDVLCVAFNELIEKGNWGYILKQYCDIRGLLIGDVNKDVI